MSKQISKLQKNITTPLLVTLFTVLTMIGVSASNVWAQQTNDCNADVDITKNPGQLFIGQETTVNLEIHATNITDGSGTFSQNLEVSGIRWELDCKQFTGAVGCTSEDNPQPFSFESDGQVPGIDITTNCTTATGGGGSTVVWVTDVIGGSNGGSEHTVGDDGDASGHGNQVILIPTDGAGTLTPVLLLGNTADDAGDGEKCDLDIKAKLNNPSNDGDTTIVRAAGGFSGTDAVCPVNGNAAGGEGSTSWDIINCVPEIDTCAVVNVNDNHVCASGADQDNSCDPNDNQCADAADCVPDFSDDTCFTKGICSEGSSVNEGGICDEDSDCGDGTCENLKGICSAGSSLNEGGICDENSDCGDGTCENPSPNTIGTALGLTNKDIRWKTIIDNNGNTFLSQCELTDDQGAVGTLDGSGINVCQSGENAGQECDDTDASTIEADCGPSVDCNDNGVLDSNGMQMFNFDELCSADGTNHAVLTCGSCGGFALDTDMVVEDDAMSECRMCDIDLQKEVSCNNGTTWGESCTGWTNGADEVKFRYKLTNDTTPGNGVDINDCLVMDPAATGGMVVLGGVGNTDPTPPLAPGEDTGFFETSAIACAVSNPGTATAECACLTQEDGSAITPGVPAGGRFGVADSTEPLSGAGTCAVNASDGASVSCQTVGLNIEKFCTDGDGDNAFDVLVQVWNSGEANLENCVVTDELDPTGDMTPVALSPGNPINVPTTNNAGNKIDLTGTTAELLEDTTNKATVVCEIAGTFVANPCTEESNGEGGCEADSACEATVCAQDSFCCSTAWDDFCRIGAEELCDPLVAAKTVEVDDEALCDVVTGGCITRTPGFWGRKKLVTDAIIGNAEGRCSTTSSISCTDNTDCPAATFECDDGGNTDCTNAGSGDQSVCDGLGDEFCSTGGFQCSNAVDSVETACTGSSGTCTGGGGGNECENSSIAELNGVDCADDTAALCVTLAGATATCEEEFTCGLVTPAETCGPGGSLTSCGVEITGIMSEGSALQDICGVGNERKDFDTVSGGAGLCTSPQQVQLVRQCMAATLNLEATRVAGGQCEGDFATGSMQCNDASDEPGLICEDDGDCPNGACVDIFDTMFDGIQDVMNVCCNDPGSYCLDQKTGQMISESGCIEALDLFNNLDTEFEDEPENELCPNALFDTAGIGCNAMPQMCNDAQRDGHKNDRPYGPSESCGGGGGGGPTVTSTGDSGGQDDFCTKNPDHKKCK